MRASLDRTKQPVWDVWRGTYPEHAGTGLLGLVITRATYTQWGAGRLCEGGVHAPEVEGQDVQGRREEG